MNTYEGLLIFSTTIKEDELDKVLDRIGDEMSKLGGSVQSRDVLGKRAFARPMQKREAGLYVKMMFSFDPDKLAALQGRFKLIDEIFRVQIIKQKAVKTPAAKAAPPPAEAPAAEAPVKEEA